jgi:predicted amidohydrolase YtcJ
VSAAHPTVLIRSAEIGGRPGLDVRIGPGSVEEIGPRLLREPGEPVLDAAGGAVIPGLHDHHVHLRAVVAARQSLDVSAAPDQAGFDRLVSAAASSHTASWWLRVTGWDENRAGALDRTRLDALTGAVPARVQHRSGAMWVLNSAALAAVGALTADRAGIERDEKGAPTGRLLRLDTWLRDRLPAHARGSFTDGLAEYSSWSARAGVTGFTDATPERDQADIDDFCALSESGAIRQRIVLMAPPDLRVPAGGHVRLGPRKVILDDATLPSAGELASLIASTHRQGAAIAVHCVTAEQLVVCTAAFEQARACDAAAQIPAAADRVEHASIVPPGYAGELARLKIAVVTQPGFVAERGDAYLAHMPAPERDWMYPCASLLRAGVTVAASTDAPFGPSDPWACITAASARRTRSGRVLAPAEKVAASEALRLFLANPGDLRQTRTVAVGTPADLCVLRAPLAQVLAAPSADAVAATVIDGTIAWRR